MSSEEIEETTDPGEEIIAVCSECHSDNPDRYVENNPHYKAGNSVPCRYCGGVLIIVDRASRDLSLNQRDRERGLA